jgi:acyl carrier protein
MMTGSSEILRPEIRRRMAATFGISLADLPLEATPDNTRGWDSLAHLVLIETLEKQYGLTISHVDAVSLLSDAEIATFIASK